MAAAPHIIFEDFLCELKKADFALSLHDYIEFTAIFNEFGNDKAGFKYYLAPIICRNKEEQEKFYALYDRFYLTPSPPVRRGAAQPLPPSYYKDPWSVSKLFRSFLFWVGFILLIGAGVRLRILLMEQHARQKLITDEIVVKPDTVHFSPNDAVTERSGPVFVAKKLRPHSDSGDLKSRVIPVGQPIEKQNTVHSTAFTWLVVLGLACLGVSTSFFPQKKSKFLPEVDLDTRRGDDAPVDLPFRPKDFLIQKQPVLTRLAARLTRPIPTGFYQLDIKKTIHACVSNYGLLEPVYKDRERRPHYLVLIHRSNTLFCHLSRWLTRTLISEAVSINYYFFDDISAYFADSGDKAFSFNSLRERHDPDRLIVLSEDYSLTHEIDSLSDDVPVEDIRSVLSAGTEDSYQGVYFNGKDMHALKDYLEDDDLFQWVCALAVYPTIKWEVLLSIGVALLTASQSLHKLNYTNLLKIIRIRWLNDDTIPQDIRIELLKSLRLRPELIAREKIIELLKESDEIIAAGSPAHKQKRLLLYTQSFVLYANDTRKNRQYEQDAKKFLSLWDKKAVPDLATVIYLKNQEKQWDTPVRSVDNTSRPVEPNKFLNELLAMRVISDPTVRRYFRNAGISCFAILCLLFLFRDNVQGWGINQTLGLIERDYVSDQVVVRIPVTDCLKKKSGDGRLIVTLNNYDNNRYSKTVAITDKDSLTVAFDDITMSGKSPEKETFQIILNNSLTIPCTYKEFYARYDLLLQGGECTGDFRPNPSHIDMTPTHPGAVIQ